MADDSFRPKADIAKTIEVKRCAALALVFLALASSGCDDVFKATESEADRKAKVALAGVWFYAS